MMNADPAVSAPFQSLESPATDELISGIGFCRFAGSLAG